MLFLFVFLALLEPLPPPRGWVLLASHTRRNENTRGVQTVHHDGHGPVHHDGNVYLRTAVFVFLLQYHYSATLYLPPLQQTCNPRTKRFPTIFNPANPANPLLCPS